MLTVAIGIFNDEILTHIDSPTVDMDGREQIKEVQVNSGHQMASLCFILDDFEEKFKKSLFLTPWAPFFGP